MSEQWLGKRARAKWGVTGTLHSEGDVVAYCAAPQVCIRMDDGSQLWWRADMCELIDEEPS